MVRLDNARFLAGHLTKRAAGRAHERRRRWIASLELRVLKRVLRHVVLAALRATTRCVLRTRCLR
jgi:hypothetical protein